MKFLTFTVVCTGLWIGAIMGQPLVEASWKWYRKRVTPTLTPTITPTAKPTQSPTPSPKPTLSPSPTPKPTLSPTPTPKLSRKLMWGFYSGWKTSDIAEFQSNVAASSDMAALFVHWGNENEFPAEAGKMLSANNQTMVIYWEYMDYNMDGPTDSRFTYDQILSGKWDTYINSFALAAKNYGSPVILIPFEEANGNWYPWSGTANGNTPAKHIAAYRYLKNKFKDAENVKFGWAMNAASVPDLAENTIEKYYPGDEYVDIAGVNGFNFGNPWTTYDQIFKKPLETLSTFNKPIMIFSTACSDGPGKAEWISDMQKKVIADARITGWIWFNENKERDWRVWSDPDSLKAFKQMVTASELVPDSQ